MRILIAEADRSLAQIMKVMCTRGGMETDLVLNGTDAVEYLKLGSYDGAVIDAVLPRLSGFDVLIQIRESGVQTPCLTLTSKDSVEETVSYLDAGANDVLRKPFDAREMMARIRAMTRKNTGRASSLLTIGNLSLDRRNMELSTPSGCITLTMKEFQLIEMMMFNPGVLVHSNRIFEKIWGCDSKVEINVVWVNMSNIRKALKCLNANVRIRTVRNVGYRIEETSGEQT